MNDTNVDEVKGRAEQVAGILTGDRSLEREGQVSRTKGSVKSAADRVAEALTRTRNKGRRQ
jgi:uncharacterized protein YjbJ (UPF0337 family)